MTLKVVMSEFRSMLESYMRVFSYLSYLHCLHMEVGLGMRLGVLGSDLPILGGNVPKNDPVHSFFILLTANEKVSVFRLIV